MGRLTMGLGRGLTGFGNLIGWRGAAAAGARLVQSAMSMAPRLSENLLGRQEAALRALLRDFREGRLERALKRALPLGEEGSRGGVPTSNPRLPINDVTYSLNNLLGTISGAVAWWIGGFDVRAELINEYRKAAEQAALRGDYRRAAFIYGKLLRDFRMAASTLLRGGLPHDAAILYLKKVGDTLAAAQAFEAAGEIDRALQLYRGRGDHILAGDLLRRAGEEEAALAEYQLAAQKLVESHQDYHSAGELLLTRAGRLDLALPYFRAGWDRRSGATLMPGVVPCAMRLAHLFADEESPTQFMKLVAEAEEFFGFPGRDTEAGQFFNHIARLSEQKNLQSVRDDLRDRALLAITVKLRQRAEVQTRPGDLIAAMLGRSGAWRPPIVSDADVAWKNAFKRPDRTALPSPDRGVTRVHIRAGVFSAAMTAPSTGEIFLGYETGEIYCFRPLNGEVLQVSLHPMPVSALSVAHDGSFVVALRKGERNFFLAAYSRGADGSFRPTENRILDDSSMSWLTPNLRPRHIGSSYNQVGIGNNRTMKLLQGTNLLPCDDVIPPSEEATINGGLLLDGLRPFEHDSHAVFLWDQLGFWYFPGPRTGDEPVSLRGSLGWRPWLPADHPFSSIPLAWLHRDPTYLEVAGIAETGILHWSGLQFKDNPLQCFSSHIHYRAKRFLTATIIRSGLVAAVSSDDVDWLRCAGQSFSLWSRTTVHLSTAIACFPSHPTNELLVVCGDGFLVRIPVPK
jgi:tetratricopeptide (TPR) repeat protein